MFLPSVSDPRLVSPTAQGPLDGSSDASRSLSSLRDLLPALAALAPTGASPLIDALLRWQAQQQRALAQSSGSGSLLWQSQILQLAFWHAVHRILAPLPPGALPRRDVLPLVDAALDAALASDRPAPPWDAWPSRPLAGGDPSAGGTSGAADAVSPDALVPLVPSPSVRELAARCLGLASRHDPATATSRFVDELESRAASESTRAHAHILVHAARYLHVDLGGSVVGLGGERRDVSAADASLRAAAATVRALTPTDWAPAHRKSDLRHALCALLAAVLAPVAGARIPEWASREARGDWAAAVARCREETAGWIKSKEKKHAAAGVPLLGALHAAEALCGGDGGEGLHAFLDTTLVRALKETKHRAPAVEALRAVVEGIAPPLPPRGDGPAPAAPPLPEVTRSRLRAALAAAAAGVKKGPSDPSLTLAVARATAATSRVDPLLAADVVAELLREGKVSDAVAAGLTAVPDIVLLTAPRSGVRPGLAGVLTRMRDDGLDPLSGLVDRVAGERGALARDASSSDRAAAATAAAAAADLARNLRRQLGAVARALQTSRPTEEASVAVAVALLRCVPFVAPEEWRGAALGEAVPPLCAHPHPAVRVAAGDAIRRAVSALPTARDAIVQGLAAVMLRSPTATQAGISLVDADVAVSAAETARDACAAWREATVATDADGNASSASFGTLRPEAAGLLLLCSPDAGTRGAAAEMLREIAALASVIRRAGGRVAAGAPGDDASVANVERDSPGTANGVSRPDGARETHAPPPIAAVLEACAGDMVRSALGGEMDGSSDDGSGRRDGRVDANVGATAVVRHVHGAAWTSALGALAARAAAASPEVTTTARAQALHRVQAKMMHEGLSRGLDGPRAPTDPNSSVFDAWRNCTCFVCAASPSGAETTAGGGGSGGGADGEDVMRDRPGVPPNPLLLPHGRLAPTRSTPLGARGSLASLFALLAPCLRDGGAQAAAAAAVLAMVPSPAAPQLLAALAPLQASLSAGLQATRADRAGAGTPFDRRGADRELRAHLARLHLRLAASGAVSAAPPGPTGRDAAAKHLLAFIDGTVEYAWSTSAAVECGPEEVARLQFAAAATTTSCVREIVASASPETADRETRAKLWERFRVVAERASAALAERRGANADGRSDGLGSLATASRRFSGGGGGGARSFGGSDAGSDSGRHSRGKSPGSAVSGGAGSTRTSSPHLSLYRDLLSAWRGTSASLPGSVDRNRLGLPPAASDDGDGATEMDDASVASGRSAGGSFDPTHPAAMAHAAHEAMAALLAGPAFDDDARKPHGRVLTWIGETLNRAGRGGRAGGAARRALGYHLNANPDLAHTALDGCYSPNEQTAAAYLSALADLYSGAAAAANGPGFESPSPSAGSLSARPSCPPAKLVVLALYRLVHPSASVRDDAVALLTAVASLELGDGAGGEDALSDLFSHDALPELPDAYQAFQQGVSRHLARQRPNLGEELLVEALGRQMDEGAADAGAHRHVLAALAPWVASLHLPHIAAAGRADRLLKSLYFVTFVRGDAFPREIETLWRDIGKTPRNVVPALRFLEAKGLEDMSSARAMSTYCLTAKRVCLYLARAAPQQSIDQLVYAISLRGLEVDYPPGRERERASERDADRLSQADVMSEWSGSRSGRGTLDDDDDDDDDEGLAVSAPDLAIILLAEVAAEHDEDFRVHLPVLLHAVVATLAGSPEPTVRAHCRQLLANLAHALAARPLAARRRAQSPAFANGDGARDTLPGADLGGPHAALANADGQGGWHGEVGRWGRVVSDPGGGGGGRHRDRDGDGSFGGYGARRPPKSGEKGAEGIHLTDAEESRGRAAVARLQGMLARPGGGGAGGLKALVGGVIARGASSEGGASWSPESIARLVTLLPDALVFEPGLREQWADEARRWLLRAASFPLASASARVLAALRAPLDPDAADALLAALCSSAAAAEGGTVARGLEFGRRYPGQHGRWRPPSAGFGGVSARSAAAAADLAGLLLDTLSEMFSLVRREADAIRYPQVFWGAAACLRTLHPPLYARAARLVSVMALAWPLDDPTGAAETILAVSAPVAVGDEYPKAARRIAADAADAAVDAWCANVKPGGFARRWSPPLGVPDPAASLADLVPLLLKGVARRDAAPHAARALAALAGAAGAGGAAWGGERALALLLAGLLPVVIAAAAAAEEEAAREAEDPRGLAGGGVGGVGVVGGVGGVGGVGAGGFATGASPGTPGSASTPNPADAPDFSATTTPGRTPTGTPDGTSAFDFGSGRYAHASPRASPTSGASPAVADAARRRASPRAGPLGVAEGAAAGRWLAAGLRAAAPGGANDILAASLESILPSRRARGAAPLGRRYAAPPPPRPRLPPPPPPPPPGAPRHGRLADVVADPLAAFVFPDHAAPFARVLVDIAASASASVSRGGFDDAAEDERGEESAATAAAALAVLTRLVTRADRVAADALLRAGGGGGAPSIFAPIASLLEGAHSSAALELLQRVAGLRAEGAGEDEYDADEVDWGRVARLGSPRQMWDSVDANGGRAVDLMYGVMLSGGMDPERAALPACLVGDSVDQ